MMAKVICMFNHKGGVSKTTTTYNLGWMLAEKGHRVVLVDADSQLISDNYSSGQRQLDFPFAHRSTTVSVGADRGTFQPAVVGWAGWKPREPRTEDLLSR